MSDEPTPDIAISATGESDVALDREKWVAEKAFRDRELILKEREQDRFEDELHLKREEARRSRWSSPLVIAILGAAAAAAGNAGVAWQSAKDQRRLESERAVISQQAQELNNRAQLTLESFKAEAARVFEVVKTNDPDKAASNLQFLLTVGLITNQEVKRGLSEYLEHRKAGEGFSLPAPGTPSGSIRSPLFNLNTALLPPDFHPQDEVTYMVKLLRQFASLSGNTIKTALSLYSSNPDYATHVVSVMQHHGYPSVTTDSKIDFNDAKFMKSLLWAIAYIDTKADIPPAVLDGGIGQNTAR